MASTLAWANPASHIFEGMRTVLISGVCSTDASGLGGFAELLFLALLLHGSIEPLPIAGKTDCWFVSANNRPSAGSRSSSR